MDKISHAMADITQENIEKLIQLFPSVATEAANTGGDIQTIIDFDALRELLGDVAEGPRERYQFTWPGKQGAKLKARRPCAKTMRPCPEKSVEWDTTENLYIEGENLEALKLMRETYAGKVNLIYIDPPYNTGHDFIYDDDFSQTREDYDAGSGEYDEDGGRLVANPESNGRFHSDWCSMIYPRLLLARDFLSADGAIFISIDDHESANLRKICDEVFGSLCFAGDVAWQRNYSPRNDSKGIPVEVEHLLVYSKTPGWTPGKLPRTEEMDERYGSPDGDSVPWKADNASAPGAATHHGMVYAIQHPITGKLLYPPNGRCWTFGQQQMLKIMDEWTDYELRTIDDGQRRSEICGCPPSEIEDDVQAIMLVEDSQATHDKAMDRYNQGVWPRLYFTSKGKGGLACKRYLDAVEGKMPTNLWTYSDVGHSDEAKKELKKLFDGVAPFDTPKPVRLLSRILQIASSDDSIVLDFYSGSGTMAEAVMTKNAEDQSRRQFILVQIPDAIPGEYGTLCNVGEERIRRVGAKIKAEVEESNKRLELGAEPKPVPDIGFRVLKIDSSNFNDTYVEPDALNQLSIFEYVDNLKEGRTPEDLLFQVLPKFRIPYSAKIEKRTVEGKTVLDVNGGQLIACFDEDVTTGVIEEIAKAKPLYAVFRDASMADDATAANLEELFKTYSPETIRRVI